MSKIIQLSSKFTQRNIKKNKKKLMRLFIYLSIPETQLAERLHGERYYGDARMPLSMPVHHQMPGHHHGVRGVDLGNHMIGADNLHTILRTEDPRNIPNKSYYYG